jgi:hypothetical protein
MAAIAWVPAAACATGRRRRALRHLRLAAMLLLGACASSPPRPQPDLAAVERYQAAGYALRAPLAPAAGLMHYRLSAPVARTPWTVSLTALANPGPAPRPLLVYLPPLGDADDAPNQWIELWARAGYAVLCIQALDSDAAIWTTDEARSGDFERVARARFGSELMADRITRLARLLGEVLARGRAGEPVMAGLDWDHAALVGADLGAYTVQSLLSQSPQQLAELGWPLSPAAYLAVSPYARPGRSSPPAPAGHAPVLMISARDDVDAYGVVGDAAIRHRAFDEIGAGDEDYYFELGGASHRWLSGVPAAPAYEPVARRAAPLPSESADGRRGQHGDALPGDEDDLSPAAAAKLKASRIERETQQANLRSRQLTQAALAQVSFQDISLAFLDAYVRRDAAARAWLRDTAPHWLQDGDRLKHR